MALFCDSIHPWISPDGQPVGRPIRLYCRIVGFIRTCGNYLHLWNLSNLVGAASAAISALPDAEESRLKAAPTKDKKGGGLSYARSGLGIKPCTLSQPLPGAHLTADALFALQTAL